MTRKRILGQASISALLIAACAEGVAQEDSRALASPRWSYEIRAGSLEPDLELFETFYGDDSETIYGLAGAYRIRDWLEIGGEYGSMTARGVGVLSTSQTLGGDVKYRLSPIHVLANFVFQRSVAQRVVPYLGLGLTVAEYRQDIEQQPGIDGHTDIGNTIRAGVRFRIATHGPYASAQGSPYWRSLAFIEAQTMSAEADGVELGGDAVLIGFRMEFDFDRR